MICLRTWSKCQEGKVAQIYCCTDLWSVASRLVQWKRAADNKHLALVYHVARKHIVRVLLLNVAAGRRVHFDPRKRGQG